MADRRDRETGMAPSPRGRRGERSPRTGGTYRRLARERRPTLGDASDGSGRSPALGNLLGEPVTKPGPFWELKPRHRGPEWSANIDGQFLTSDVSPVAPG